MLMADHGLVLYGNAIMVNPDFAKANPKVVAGFVRATIKGIIDTYKDPESRDQIGHEAQRNGRRKDRTRTAQDVAARQLRDRLG
jgi:ABC-type nitrate/sulfonate/bicarbonate transport system substrate-binding protein